MFPCSIGVAYSLLWHVHSNNNYTFLNWQEIITCNFKYVNAFEPEALQLMEIVFLLSAVEHRLIVAYPLFFLWGQCSLQHHPISLMNGERKKELSKWETSTSVRFKELLLLWLLGLTDTWGVVGYFVRNFQIQKWLLSKVLRNVSGGVIFAFFQHPRISCQWSNTWYWEVVHPLAQTFLIPLDTLAFPSILLLDHVPVIIRVHTNNVNTSGAKRPSLK